MVEVKVIGSSSKGNGYLLSDGERSLLLEAGINLKWYKAIDFSMCDACLITHEHDDHAKFAQSIISNSGMDVYLSAGTQEMIQLPKHRTRIVKALEEIQIGNWNILPFPVEHDVKEPLGFFIQSKDGDCILFATDTFYIRYRFPGITHMMIECNYAKDIIDEKVAAGKVHPTLRKRIMKSHFELDNVKNFIAANDTSQLQEIWLLHLSSSNADAKRFKKEIQELTGVPVYIAGE